MARDLEEIHKRAISSAFKYGFGEYAEDLAQEVVLDFLEGRSEFGTVDQATIDVIRRNFGRPGTPGFERRQHLTHAHSIFTEDGEETIGTSAPESAGLRGDIERGLGCLSPDERLIFELSHIFGLLNKEIALELDVSESRISQKLMQIESKLRVKMSRGVDSLIERGIMEGKCKRPGCLHMAVKGMAYCSRDCAPFGNYGLTNTGRDKTEKSSTREPGAPSQLSYESAKSIGSATLLRDPFPNLENTKPNESERSMQSTVQERQSENVDSMPTRLPKSASANQRHGWSDDDEMLKLRELQSEPGMSGMPMIREEKSSSAVEGEILPSDSSDLSTRLNEETLASLNLINDTANQLFGVMKSYGKASRSQEEVVTYSPQQINAICNLGKNITNALRLKLDISKSIKNGK